MRPILLLAVLLSAAAVDRMPAPQAAPPAWTIPYVCIRYMDPGVRVENGKSPGVTNMIGWFDMQTLTAYIVKDGAVTQIVQVDPMRIHDWHQMVPQHPFPQAVYDHARATSKAQAQARVRKP